MLGKMITNLSLHLMGLGTTTVTLDFWFVCFLQKQLNRLSFSTDSFHFSHFFSAQDLIISTFCCNFRQQKLAKLQCRRVTNVWEHSKLHHLPIHSSPPTIWIIKYPTILLLSTLAILLAWYWNWINQNSECDWFR